MLGRPVSDKLGPEAGWAGLTAWPAGGLLVGLGLSLVSDTSGRPGHGEGKSEDSLWRRDLSALGPKGAEANLLLRQPGGDYFKGGPKTFERLMPESQNWF